MKENERNGERWQIGSDTQTLQAREEACLESWSMVWERGEGKERTCGKAYLGTAQLLCWRGRIGGEGKREGKKKKKKKKGRLAFKA